jgi:hypothetical protein
VRPEVIHSPGDSGPMPLTCRKGLPTVRKTAGVHEETRPPPRQHAAGRPSTARPRTDRGRSEEARRAIGHTRRDRASHGSHQRVCLLPWGRPIRRRRHRADREPSCRSIDSPGRRANHHLAITALSRRALPATPSGNWRLHGKRGAWHPSRLGLCRLWITGPTCG